MKRQKWGAYIKGSDKDIYLGYYKDFHGAVMARFCGELQYGWAASNPNTPAKQYVDKYFNRNSATKTGKINDF